MQLVSLFSFLEMEINLNFRFWTKLDLNWPLQKCSKNENPLVLSFTQAQLVSIILIM